MKKKTDRIADMILVREMEEDEEDKEEMRSWEVGDVRKHEDGKVPRCAS